MELQKLNVKIFTTEPSKVPLTNFIDIFHRWIQETDGVYHDVADYSHMVAGPGIVLVAKDAHVSIDETDHRHGLVYSQKSLLGGSNRDKLRSVLSSALVNCRRLEKEPSLGGKLKFNTSEILIWINDRLAAPNTEEAFQQINPEINALANRLYNEGKIDLAHDRDPRKPLNARIRSLVATDLETLLERLAKS